MEIVQRTPRSFLFVPADRPDRFDKASGSGADEIIVDLEDAVPLEKKEAARESIASWSGRHGAVLRINPWQTRWFDGDLALVRSAGITKIMIPKADPESLNAAHTALGAGVALIALIESVAGLLQLRTVCSQPGLVRLAFGNLDFGVDSGVAEEALDSVRLQISLESRFAGLLAPIDGVCQSLTDPLPVTAQAKRAKALGFGGKLCIHPAQVGPVNAAFEPTAEETAWARRIVDAVEKAGNGAISVDGKMVDRPVAERARSILRAVRAG